MNTTEPGGVDLAADTLMMDDFAPDIDLLDEFMNEFGMGDDWKGIEPSLNFEVDPLISNNSPMIIDQQQQRNFMTMTMIPSSPANCSTPILMPTSPMTSIPSPQEFKFKPELLPAPPVQVQTQTQAQIQNIQMSTSSTVNSSPITTTAILTNLTPIQPMMTKTSPINIAPLQAIKQNGQQQLTTTIDKKCITSNTTNTTFFSIPVYTNQILVPQLSLALMDSSEKLPVKRLTNEKQPKKKEQSRRSSHNAIERRYRSSINDKIVELKSLVCPSTDGNDKVHKAAILKSSIDTIRHLNGLNTRLEKENKYLKQHGKCPQCGFESVQSVRDLLQGPNTPPDSSDSSLPASPEESSLSPQSSQGRGSPLALFGIAAGIFLLNPITSTYNSNEIMHDGRSRVERSVEPDFINLRGSNSIFDNSWTPRILALCFNLVLFMIIYYLTGKIGKKSRVKKSNYEHKLIQEISTTYKNSIDKPEKERGKDLDSILEKTGDKLTRIRFYHKYYAFIKAILKMFSKKHISEQDQDYYKVMTLTWIEIGKMDKSMSNFSGLKAVYYSIDSLSNDLLLQACILTQSKLFLRLAIALKLKNSNSSHALLSKTGLPFLLTNINSTLISTPNRLTSCINDKDPLSRLLHKYKEEMLDKGILSLFESGFNSSIYFKAAMNAVLNERGNIKSKDYNCEWWSAIFWTEAEWIFGGRRKPVLERLYKLVDALYKHQDDSLSKAIYYCHLAKRIMFNGDLKSDNMSAKRLLENASNALRDSINLSTEKPPFSIQLIWALASEWILEARLAIWDETLDPNISVPFQKDLDTLRSLTHYVPQCLPTVFLYEAVLRLMSGASPGRTQNLLDACLRNARSNQKTGLICTESENCANKRNGFDGNLVKEKRKATALYLRCKFLPSLVITCPGEKIGLLREALKALEKIGDQKKIKECLDMMKRSEASLVY